MNNLVTLKDQERAMIAAATERFLAECQIAEIPIGMSANVSGRDELRRMFVITSPAKRKIEPKTASGRTWHHALEASVKRAAARRAELAKELREFAAAGHTVSDAARHFQITRRLVRKVAHEAGITLVKGVNGR